MTLNPFIFGSARRPSCFDEPSPCKLEQTSMCVIDVAQKKDASSKFPGQSVYVPWLSCMDGSGDKTAMCNKKVGIDPDDVQACLKSDIKQLMLSYMKKDMPIHSTPTAYVNGKDAGLSFRKIKAAICRADPSLSGCAAPTPPNADWEPEQEEVPPHESIVV